MRTTLDIDDTVLAAARSLARAEHISLGAAVSMLARRGLGAPPGDRTGAQARVEVSYSPFAILMGDPDHDVTPDLVNAFRDDE